MHKRKEDQATGTMKIVGQAAEQVSVITGLSEETLAQWRSKKRGISYLKIGRAVRYDPAEVQVALKELMGDSHISVTMRYVHPTPEHKREAVDKLEKFNVDQLFAVHEKKQPGSPQ